jgi:hypothetical protein
MSNSSNNNNFSSSNESSSDSSSNNNNSNEINNDKEFNFDYLRKNLIKEINLEKKIDSVTPQQLYRLGAGLHNTPVTAINLSNNGLKEPEMLALIQGLHNTQITKLNFSHNMISGNATHLHQSDFISFKQSAVKDKLWTINQAPCFSNLQSNICVSRTNWITLLNQALLNSKITNLNFSQNRIDANGACTLLEATQETFVEKINFHGNQIKHEGIAFIGDALEKTQITKLNLSANQVNNAGLAVLAMSLPKTQLMALNLSKNTKITNLVAPFLTDILAKTKLVNLELSETQIDQVQKNKMEQVLTNNYKFEFNAAIINFKNQFHHQVEPKPKATNSTLQLYQPQFYLNKP